MEPMRINPRIFASSSEKQVYPFHGIVKLGAADIFVLLGDKVPAYE